MTTLDGFLLGRQWRDTASGIELSYWASTDQGPLQVIVHGQEAVCFIARAQSLQLQANSRRVPVELRLLGGDLADALYFRQQRDLASLNSQPMIRQQLWESDLKPSDRYLMERFITASFTAAGNLEQRDGYLSLRNPRLKTSGYEPKLKLAAIDIETEGLDGALYSIAGYSSDEAWVFMVGSGDDAAGADFRLQFCVDESACLRAFFDWLRRCDPDLIVGWNVIDFDLDFIGRKCRQLHLPFALGRAGQNATILQPASDNQPRIARIPGRVALDGIDLLRAAFWSFESFALEDVAQELLGEGKLIGGDRETDKVATIDALFRNDKQRLAEYNLQDCRLVVKIFEHADLVNFAIQRARLTGLNIDRLGGSVAALDNLYLPRLHRKGYVAPNVTSGNDGLASPGGYVLDSRPGLYQNVLVLDFKSLYPSIIRTFLIDPLGLAVANSDAVPGFIGASFSRTEHILPGLIEQLWRRRDEAKRARDPALSQAIKIIMNSFYGVLGTSSCRFHNPQLTSSITRRGHEIITRSQAHIESLGYRVIYGDTDSIFVLLGEEVEEANAAEIGRQLVHGLNDWWATHLQQEYRLQSALDVEFERHYIRFLMPTIRGMETGSKKRYAGTIRASNGELRMVFKGLEAVRTDWTPLAREFQRELYRRIFLELPFEDYIRETAAALSAGKSDARLVYRKRIRRRLAEYQRNVPPHIQAARKQANPGKWVSYVITVNGPEPIEAIQSRLDYQHYLDRQLAPVADGILYFLETNFASITSAQLSLF